MKNIRASIDIGSNSILLVAGDFNHGYKELLNESRVTGLGRDLDVNKKFIPIAMDESFEALKEYADLCRQYGISPQEILTTATEASRVATNAKDFFSKVKKDLGIKVSIITSEAEAYFSAKGIMFGAEIADERIFIMDIGGASTEIICLSTRDLKVISSFSMPMGSVRVSNWLKDGVASEKIQEIFERFKTDLINVQTKKLYCVAGTMTSIANMHLKNKTFQEDQVHGLVMSKNEVMQVKENYFQNSEEEILMTFPFLGKRTRSIKGGMFMVNMIFNILPVHNVYISTYGLRYGTLQEGEIQKKYLA
jgi:exopolyphosphatase/guanosine-5'-triphosphate,3'-diphosphate pyrophosphatase